MFSLSCAAFPRVRLVLMTASHPHTRYNLMDQIVPIPHWKFLHFKMRFFLPLLTPAIAFVINCIWLSWFGCMPRLCPPLFPLLPLIAVHRFCAFANLSFGFRPAVPHLATSRHCGVSSNRSLTCLLPPHQQSVEREARHQYLPACLCDLSFVSFILLTKTQRHNSIQGNIALNL